MEVIVLFKIVDCDECPEIIGVYQNDNQGKEQVAKLIEANKIYNKNIKEAAKVCRNCKYKTMQARPDCYLPNESGFCCNVKHAYFLENLYTQIWRVGENSQRLDSDDEERGLKKMKDWTGNTNSMEI